MANLAQIQSIAQGQFFVKDSLGNLVELKVGDTVSLNDTIVAASSNTDLSKIEILFDTNELITLSQGEQLLDATLLASTFGNEELAFDKQEVDETLNAWNNAQDGDATDMETAAGDVTEQATNAGNEEAADGGALRSKFNSRDGDATDIVSDLRAAPFGGATTQEPQEQIPTELLNPSPVAGVTPAVPETGTGEAPLPPVITIEGSEVREITDGTSTGDKVIGQVTIKLDKAQDTDLIITLSNGQEVVIPKGETSVVADVETSRVDDVYYQGTTYEDVSIKSTSNSDIDVTDKKATITINDDIDPVAVKITAVQTTEKVITKDNFENNAGFTVEAKDPYGKEAKISTHGNPAGFGVQSDAETNFLGQTDKVYSGHTSEIGVVKDKSTGEYLSESIEVVFKNPIQTLDVAFAWRHNGERAKVDFYNGDTKVGYAIVKGGGSNTDAIVEYYIGNETTPNTTVQAQGGTDQVDLVYTFKPANNVSFTKAVFSADGAGSDYLIHSIKYKEAVGEDNTTVVGSQEVAFKIETSVKPDPSWIAKGNTPTAHVKIVDGANNIVFEGDVNLDKNGNKIVTVRTDGTKDLIAEVSNVQGNFEKVEYVNGGITTIEGTLKPIAGDDSVTTNEDTPYTLTKDDFGNIGNTTNTQNVAKIKFTEVPENGKIYVLKTEYIGSVNEKADYSESTKQFFDEIKAGDIVDISQIEKGNVIFVPNKDTDDNGEFKFKVSSGGISDSSFKGDYTTTIDVKAVADKPTVSIDVEQIIDIKEGVFQKNDGQYYKKINELPKENIDNNKESEKFELGGKTNSVKLDMNLTGNQANGKIVFYNGNDVVGGQDLKDGSKTYDNSDKFDSFKIVHTGTPGDGSSSIHFTKYSTIIEVLASDAERPTNDYNIDIYAALNDRDGSETLSVVIKNVPESATLESSKYEIIKNEDGSYTVKVPAGAKDISDTLTLKGATTKPDIEIVATATEKNDNDNGSNFETSTARDSANSKIYTVDETSSISVNTKNTNLIFTLDITSSLVYNDYYNVKDYDILYEKGNDVLTSLHILQKSAISTIKAYEANAGKDGVVNVNMTIFSKSAHNLGWMTSKQALEYLTKLTQDSEGIELKPYELDNKLTKGTNLKPIIGQDGKNLTYENLVIDDTTTNYKNAIAETVKVNFTGKEDGNNVGYFISDGRPWDDPDTTKEDYSIGKDYEDQASWNKWETFIQKNKIDLKVIGVGTPHDNVSAKSFLKEIQFASGHRDIILIDEPTSMETIFLSTIDGTVSGDVSDNIFGGDGKVTIDSIVVDDTTYYKAYYPYGLSTTDKLGGKLTFDFETGKYAYNGNGVNITTDMSKSFQVNVSDKNGDKGSLDVNFELKAQPITDGLVKFEKGGDINFSNLENIVKLKEINLDNGKENKLSLTLDDVLKLSGDDKQIKITGDQFDSVVFKDTKDSNGMSQSWSKTAGEGVDKGFDIYVNSGDPTLQVKVEQPISDSITN
ncbi:hypothetical protein N5U22_04355 [Aliarcobacter cryaerophilus]|uniref:immunoglobulin-like domain-containing protein n=1 Tax=Aliarcobacter cryaerophilus TaxID=28198 RepID=UPI0021B64755|nr:immunoglobulin-like domain-containing protein [Aliarcobacter cryaerophilus]MCT7532627.1 hypothetical protein [Aliarcobacter cryaerophilus]